MRDTDMTYKPETLEVELPISQPRPLDQKIMGGIALTRFYDEEEVNRVTRRLDNAFQSLRSDISSEFTECIAYGVDIPDDLLLRIDEEMVDVASRQNHGMVTLAQDKGQIMRLLWGGRDELTDKRFYLGKHWAPILFDDPGATVKPGVIYSLSSHRI